MNRYPHPSAQGVTVVPGVTMTDIHRAALRAVGAAHTSGANHTWRYETAWSAVAEYVWASESQPTRAGMVTAGVRAVDAEMRRELHHHGYARPEDGGGVMRGAAAFWADYADAVPGEARPGCWRGQSHRVPSPEDAVVERLALTQVLPVLTPGQRDGLLALATAGTFSGAADSLGIDVRALRTRVTAGRGRFLAAWHEGETAPATWRVDQRTPDLKGKRNLRAAGGRRRAAPPHGTETRYVNHSCRCVDCCTAATDAARVRRRKRGIGPQKRVTASQFALIRAEREAGASITWLAKKYRASQRTISQLLRGERQPAPDAEAAA